MDSCETAPRRSTGARHLRRVAALLAGAGLCSVAVWATPANKAALKKHYDTFLADNLNRCVTCHLPSDKKNPESLAEFPHNPFGDRLRKLGEELEKQGAPGTLEARLKTVAGEDSDADGVSNETELLLGSNPGDAEQKPASLADAERVRADFEKFLNAYRWKPFESVKRPEIPEVKNKGWARTPIDVFVAAEHEKRGLRPRPEAAKEILLRRLYLDLIGLTPTIQEQEQFLNDNRTDAYERLVDRLLEDQRYGERWGRHWMDVWRYSDWAGWAGGNQIRDSKPHIWRWRDWIVESLNADKGYNQMVVEMLAADELAPEDTDALRATGFLVRNYKMLSREQWLEDTVKHTSQAFLGVTLGCAKCHDHMYDPIKQTEYYQMRAIFEPHQVRTDKVPGELDTGKAGLVRTYDTIPESPTYFFIRGDERRPDTNRVMNPGVPAALTWAGYKFGTEPVALPKFAAYPDKRKFVVEEMLSVSQSRRDQAKAALEKNPAGEEERLDFALADARHQGLLANLRAEEFDDRKDSPEWREASVDVQAWQRKATILEAKLKVKRGERAEREAAAKFGKATADQAEPKVIQAAKKEWDDSKNKLEEARKALGESEKVIAAAPTPEFKPRTTEVYPERSSGRRLAFARWVTDARNPLTARVAANHIWLRHFGRAIVPNPADFGANAAPPTNPRLLDWLAAEFMESGWSMKKLHRLIVTSAVYRMASTTDDQDLAIDPDNIYLWKASSRRMDAEVVRDNLLHCSGSIDMTMGGPEIDNNLGLTSKRRSIYLRIAAEKEVEFLKIFDGPAPTECYVRHPTVMPQQALALANSEIAQAQAKALATALASTKDSKEFIETACRRILARSAKAEEISLCEQFLAANPNQDRARENLILVLFNHNDFVTIR